MNFIFYSFIAANSLAAVRLITYRRRGADYKAHMSILAYALAVSFIGQVCHALFDCAPVFLWDSVISTIFCVLIFRASGNVSKIMRLSI